MHQSAHPLQASILLTLLTISAASAQGNAAPQESTEGQASTEESKTLPTPAVDDGIGHIETRAGQQRARAERLDAFHDFTFTDRREQSGITFVHRPPLDATAAYKMVHYDHGSAIAVADVDGDDALDIYFVSQVGGNELWRNRGEGTFENITGRSPGLAVEDRISVGASFGDIDNDGDADLYVTTVNMGNLLFINRGNGTFENATESSGTGHVAHSSGAVFFDYDLDGHLDLFVANVGVYTTDEQHDDGSYIGFEDAFSGHLMNRRTERSVLYRNLGDGTFEDVTREVDLEEDGWAGDASFADLDGNRYPELYVLDMQGDDSYWVGELRRRGRLRFVDRAPETFSKTPWGSMGIKFFDWENDGDFDLFLTDMHSDMSSSVAPSNEHLKSFMAWSDDHLEGGGDNIFGNAFYRNDDGEMTEISDAIGVENYWPWGVSVGDLNADGWEDMVVTSSMNYPFRYVENAVLLNDEGSRFERTEYVLGIEPRAAGPRKEWFEIDCPAGEDAPEPVLGAIERMVELCSFRKGRHTVLGSRGSRTAAIFDLDGDGDQDLVTGEFHDAPQVLVSNLSEKRDFHYLLIDLVGTESNRDGLGAIVEVRAGERRFHRHYDGKLGYLGQSSHPVFVGLGELEEVDSVRIRWPSGTVQEITEGIRLDGLWKVTEPSGD